MNLIIFGPQGSGKGTQALALSKHFHLKLYLAGDTMRALAKTSKDQTLQNILNLGDLVPDRFIKESLEQFIKINGVENILFEGIPRNLNQDKILTSLLTKHHGSEPFALLLTLTDVQALKRVRKRLICSRCKRPSIVNGQSSVQVCAYCKGKLVPRSDDTQAALKRRLAHFRNQTLPVAQNYERKGRLIIVDGTPSISQVSQKCVANITNFIRKHGA